MVTNSSNTLYDHLSLFPLGLLWCICWYVWWCSIFLWGSVYFSSFILFMLFILGTPNWLILKFSDSFFCQFRCPPEPFSEFLISVFILLKTRIYTHIIYISTWCIYTHTYIIIYFCIDIHCLVRVLLSFSYLDMVTFVSLNKFTTADLKFFSAKSSIWVF